MTGTATRYAPISWLDPAASDALSPDYCVLSGHSDPAEPEDGFLIRPAENRHLAAYRALRRQSFVVEQGLFHRSDADDIDADPRTTVLVALTPDGTVLGGVRVAPATTEDLGWWTGSRLVVDCGRRARGVGNALVRAACAFAEDNNALRFEATVQPRYAGMFTQLGWIRVGETRVGHAPHVRMRWPIDRIERLAQSTKALLGPLLRGFGDHPGTLGGNGFRGDDGAPVPGSELIAACDAILPSMVERDPDWAGWCSVLVNINDLAAMGAEPVGLLDAVAAPTRSLLTRVLRGVVRASDIWDVPILGGHTQLGPPALSVTALGRTTRPVPGGAGRIGQELRLTADLGGRWRTGYPGRQWDSSSQRTSAELRVLSRFVADTAPAAAKDVSMAGIAGTAGMMAEASGAGVELDVARIPRPTNAALAEWITCFPGFAMLTADSPGAATADPGPATSAVCGTLISAPGVRLRWPDGETTTAVSGTVTGLGLS
ncbi:MSMEG_0567/sll0787 family protein [Nocardia sp. BMG51109]|uniref:MSMEG_0567/sll0787 family protein n=1 Tax=Nocardia sp. BMG51109 TaxID=1056816 RepID=UPI000465739B|nr:MSMEG_0567/sll0787 family protein [Nocardia sp. BMG51109]